MLIGRTTESAELLATLEADESQFVAVYGRRRVGKTYLIRETFANRIAFQHTGLAKGALKEQLAEFQQSLKDAGMNNPQRPKTWIDAFHILSDFLSSIEGNEKKVVFIDELPWMDTPKRSRNAPKHRVDSIWACPSTEVHR